MLTARYQHVSLAARIIIQLLAAAILTGCANAPVHLDAKHTHAYEATDGDELLQRFAPVIVPENTTSAFNRLGRAGLRYDDEQQIAAYIDTSAATIYAEQRAITLPSGRQITNLVYRAHFPEVPMPHLTAGNNGGLLFIVTLDADHAPLLITTVHTCGCYLAFIPTDHLEQEALPVNWPANTQTVYGETLPSQLSIKDASTESTRFVFVTRHATHRVADVTVSSREPLRNAFRIEPMKLQPMSQLRELPLPDGARASFFRDTGWRKDYVRNAFKPLEFMFMSWWTFDLSIGMDKDYGVAAGDTATTFYTSLQPWYRQRSDMENFAEFLAFWGFRL